MVENQTTLPLTKVIVPRGKNLPSITLTLKGGSSPTVTLADALTGTQKTASLRSPVFSAADPATDYAHRYNILLSSAPNSDPAGWVTSSPPCPKPAS